MRNKVPEAVSASSGVGDQVRARHIHSLLFICSLAFCMRLVAFGMAQPWPMNEESPFWRSGAEVVNIAASIASHRGFSSPFGVPSGPTAWIPPVYPYIVSTIFMALGTRSNLAALSILTLQAMLSALTCIPIYGIAKQAFGENCALWASWGWALFPFAIVIPGLFPWETAMSGLLLALLCYLSLDRPEASASTRTALLGVGWGIAALTNTALLSVLPVFLICPYLRRPLCLPGKRIAMILVTSALVICPWLLRNWYQLGAIVPVRSNFGEELWLGNHEGGTGRIEYGVGPAENEGERQRYRALGEISYVAQRRTQAMHFIFEHRTQFLRQAFYRVRYWWFAEGESARIFTPYRLMAMISLVGMALALRTITQGPVLTIVAAIIVYPVVYYLTDVFARYRYPIDPLMMVLTGFAASQTLATGKRKISKS
jgi:4-amino-4-deoxy-L-arabinose transferase-like glycosyltransferase